MGKASLTISVGGEYKNNALDKAARDLKAFGEEAARNAGGAASALMSVGDKAVYMGGKITSAGDKMQSTGVKVAKATAPFAAFGIAAVKSLDEVDKGADAVVLATGATGRAAEELQGIYKKVAGNVVGSFGDIGGAVGEINTRFGFTGEKLQESSEQFQRFADITGVDTVTAVKKVSRYMGDAGVNADDYGKVLDQLAVAAQASGISIDALAENATKYGAPMRALGFDTQASIAVFSQWEKAGVNTEVAFSGMKKAISNWAKEGKDSRVEFKKTLDEIAACPDIASATTKAIEVFGAKAGPDLADAIKGGRFEYSKMLGIIENSQGTVSKTYDQWESGLHGTEKAMQNFQLALADVGGVIVETAAPAIEDLTQMARDLGDWWRSLDQGTQTLIVKIGAAAVAAGPLLLVGGKLVSAVGGMVTGVGKLCMKLGVFASGAKGAAGAAGSLNASTVKAATGAGMLQKGMTLLNGACKATAIGLVVSLVADLVGQLAAYSEHQKIVEDATTGMTEAMGAAEAAYSSYTPNVDGATEAMTNCAMSADDCLRKQAELAQNMRDTWTATGTTAAQVDYYAGVMEELGNKGNLTAVEQAKLKDAVDQFNGITGNSISITNSQTGELSEQASSVRNLASAYIEEAKAQAARELYAQTTKQLLQDQLSLEDATNKLNDAEQGFGIWLGDFPVFADENSVKYHELQKNVNDLQGAVDSGTATQEKLLGVMSNSAPAFSTLDAALGGSAAKMEGFGDVCTNELSGLAGSFDGSLSSIVDACKTKGVAIPTSLANSITSNASLPQGAQQMMLDAMVLQICGGDVEAAAKVLGHEIDGGLKAGIEGSADMPKEAVGIMSQDTIAKAKEVFQSHSPSQVMHDLGHDIDTGLQNGIDGSASLPQDSMSTLGTLMQNAISGLPGFLQGTGSSSGSGLASALGGFAGAVSTSARSLFSSATGGVAGTPGAFSGTGSSAASRFSSAIGGASAYGSGRSLASTAHSGLGSVSANGAGSNFARGFANGMGGVNVWNAAYSVGMSALGAIKQALGIASPSKEAISVGEYFGEGAIVGMKRTERGIQAEANRMSEAMDLNPHGKYGASIRGTYSAEPVKQQAPRSIAFNVCINVTCSNANEATQAGKNIANQLYTEFARRERSW